MHRRSNVTVSLFLFPTETSTTSVPCARAGRHNIVAELHVTAQPSDCPAAPSPSVHYAACTAQIRVTAATIRCPFSGAGWREGEIRPHSAHNLGHAFARNARHQQHRAAGLGLKCGLFSAISSGMSASILFSAVHTRLFGQSRGICGKLGQDGVGHPPPHPRPPSTIPIARAFDMAQELIAQAAPFGGALDQAGNVGDDEFMPVDADHAQIGMQRRERVIQILGRAFETAPERSISRHWRRPSSPASAIA